MDDLISRQAAIDALGEAPEVWTDSPEEFAALSQWEMDATAIKALPSADGKGREMDDLISRQAVLNYPIRINHYDAEHGNRDFVLGIESVMNYVESLPSAKRNTGAWVGIDDFPHQEWECNQCGKIVYTDGETGVEEYEFCPHCGAEMLNAEGDGGAEWVESSGGEHYKCSRCGYLAPYYLSTDREPCEWLSDFCPNCGKLMWRNSE